MMRSTIHAVSASDYWPLHGCDRGRPAGNGSSGSTGALTARLISPPRPRLVRDLLASGPKPRPRARRRGRPGPVDLGRHYLDLVRVPPSGTWDRRRADLYGLAEDWIPPTAMTTEAGIEWLIRRYLGGFGPAARDRHRYLGGAADGSDRPDSRADGSPPLSRLRTARCWST